MNICISSFLKEKLNVAGAAGLLIAQKSSKYIYIIHVVPVPLSKETPKKGKPFKAIQLPDFCTHACQVIPMLPGGFDIVGIYVNNIQSNELKQSETQSKLRSILKSIHHETCRVFHGLGDLDQSSTEKFVLYACPETSIIGVKMVDISMKSTFCDATLKIESTNWFQFNYNYQLKYPLYFDNEETLKFNFSRSVLKNISSWADSIARHIYLIDGKEQNAELTENDDLSILSVIDYKNISKTKSKNSLLQVCDVEIQEVTTENFEKASEENHVQESNAFILLRGNVAGKVFVHEKGSYKETIEHVRKDLVRSFVARWEMHCDSLLEEPSEPSEIVLHEPPKRVFITCDQRNVQDVNDSTEKELPEVNNKCIDSPILFCDYLFPGDSKMDACNSAKEVLDVDVLPDYVDDSAEVWPDPSEYAGMNGSELDMSKNGNKNSLQSVYRPIKKSNSVQAVIVISIALFAVLVAYYIKIVH